MRPGCKGKLASYASIVLHRFVLSPPILGMFVGLIIGMTPLQQACFPDAGSDQGPTVCTPFAGVVAMFSDAGVASQNLVLAASFFQGMLLVRKAWKSRKQQRSPPQANSPTTVHEVATFGGGDTSLNYLQDIELTVQPRPPSETPKVVEHPMPTSVANAETPQTEEKQREEGGQSEAPAPTPASADAGEVRLPEGPSPHSSSVKLSAATNTQETASKSESEEDLKPFQGGSSAKRSFVGPAIGLLVSKLVISPLLYYALYFGFNAADVPGLSIAGNSDPVFHVVVLLEVRHHCCC